MYQREVVEVRKLLALMEGAEAPFTEARTQMLFDRMMSRMATEEAAQDRARRRAWRLARVLGAVLVGAGVLQLLAL
jgi:hypothetical protein